MLGVFKKEFCLLKESGFTGNANVVGSKVKLDCQHSSFKESTSGIRITHNGNDIAHCVLKNCYPGTGIYA